jgi:hypothetical protein
MTDGRSYDPFRPAAPRQAQLVEVLWTLRKGTDTQTAELRTHEGGVELQFSRNGEWYYGFAEGNREVRLITFNFDSLIEQRLERDFQKLYPDNATLAIDAIPVHHVHGRLPDCPARRQGESFEISVNT